MRETFHAINVLDKNAYSNIVRVGFVIA